MVFRSPQVKYGWISYIPNLNQYTYHRHPILIPLGRYYCVLSSVKGRNEQHNKAINKMQFDYLTSLKAAQLIRLIYLYFSMVYKPTKERNAFSDKYGDVGYKKQITFPSWIWWPSSFLSRFTIYPRWNGCDDLWWSLISRTFHKIMYGFLNKSLKMQKNALRYPEQSRNQQELKWDMFGEVLLYNLKWDINFSNSACVYRN